MQLKEGDLVRERVFGYYGYGYGNGYGNEYGNGYGNDIDGYGYGVAII
jgi:hypothetical protein